MATRHCVVGVETPESHTQVYMASGGVLAVRSNVTLEANTAVKGGGAVSLPLEISLHLTIALFCDRFCEG